MNFRKLQTISLVMMVMLLVPCYIVQAQQQAAPSVRSSAEDARIARLIGLGKVWGTVKYFHPYLAYREIDWDKALVEAIPRVNAAKTPQEYQAAVSSMLAVLGDKNTRAEIVPEAKTATTRTANRTTTAATKETVRVEDEVLIVELATIAEFLTEKPSQAAVGEVLGKIGASLPQAKAVVMDLRLKNDFADLGVQSYLLALFTTEALEQIADSDVPLGTSRYRMHAGYASQTEAATGYYSALLQTAPETLTGRNKSKMLPMAVIIDDKLESALDETLPVSEVFSGLQATNIVLIVQEGEATNEVGIGSHTINLADGVVVRMRTTENVNPDGTIGFAADIVVPKSEKDDAAFNEALKNVRENTVHRTKNRTSELATALRGAKDKSYAEMEFPDSEHRLFALFRFWNVINYFFAYKHLIDEPWGDVPPRYIPKFEANKDAVDYQMTVRELAAETQDSHVRVQGATRSDETLGAFLPPVDVRYIERRLVVTKVFDEKATIKVGDEILAIDGEAAERRRKTLTNLVAASTPQAMNRALSREILRGRKDGSMKLTIRGADGAIRETKMPRSLPLGDPQFLAARLRTTPVVAVLPSGFGYVDLGRLRPAEVDKMFETIQKTRAAVFDMRGYPNGTAWQIAPRLTAKKDVAASLISLPLKEAPSLGDSETGDRAYTIVQKLPEAEGDVYKGKVVMLIDETTVSQAEHTALFFESATDVTFIGTPTNGTNGGVTTMVLPGNLSVRFTGGDIRHADGRQLQRIGIQPHIRIEPTILGLAAGRDEVLEAAVKHLQENIRN